MILALLWTGDPSPSGAERQALAQAGRYLAAGGHALLLAAPGGPALLAGEAYQEAGGADLSHLPAEGSPEAIARRAGALLFLGPPEPAHLAAARAAGKPAYAIASLIHGPAPDDEGLRLLPDMESFARELAKLFSRSIVSRPDPTDRRLRGRGHYT